MKKDRKTKIITKRLVIVALLFLLIGISVGYGASSSNINVIGISKIKGQKWDVHFESISNVTKIGAASDNGDGEYAPKIVELENTPSDKTDDKTLNFAIGLKLPGDKYQFQVDVVNGGSLDANAVLTVSPIESPANQYITWNVSGIDTTTGSLIKAGESKPITISVEYKDSVSDLPEEDLEVNLRAVINSTQVLS